MARKWTDIRSVKHIIMQMRKEGRTRQEIADALGLEKVQIKHLLSGKTDRPKMNTLLV